MVPCTGTTAAVELSCDAFEGTRRGLRIGIVYRMDSSTWSMTDLKIKGSSLVANESPVTTLVAEARCQVQTLFLLERRHL